MSHFATALRQCLDRSYGGKLISLSASSGIPDPEIGRLLKKKTPLTESKLQKLLTAPDLPPDDRTLLIHAAVRDFVGETEYTARFAPRVESPRTREDLGGTTFQSLFPISPRAAQVLSYIIHSAASDQDVVLALELLGRFLELPPPLEESKEDADKKGNVEYLKKPAHRRGKAG